MSGQFDELSMLRQLRFFYWFVEYQLRHGDVWPGSEERCRKLAESLGKILDQPELQYDHSPAYLVIESCLFDFEREVDERLHSQEMTKEDRVKLENLKANLHEAFLAAAHVPKEETEEIISTPLPFLNPPSLD